MIVVAACLISPLWPTAVRASTISQISEADAAEAEARLHETQAQAKRQYAAALRQLEAARQALAAAQLPAPGPAQVPMTAAPLAAAAFQVPAVAPQAPSGDLPATGSSTTSAQAKDIAAAVADEQENRGRQKFGGLEFGVGISFTLDVGKTDRVREAELVNGVVRVKDEDNGRARIMLESHYFFKPCQSADGQPIAGCSLPFGLKGGDFGWGPFMALQPGTDNIIEAVALGAMLGFRRPGEGSESFNLGLGVVVDPNTRVLGDGLIANQPLPAGETAIRYKEEMQTGLLLLASFGF